MRGNSPTSRTSIVRSYLRTGGREVIIPWMEGRLTSPTVLRDLLARHGGRLRQELGQHFLVDENTLRKIVALAAPQEDETAVEVGAGAGTLTVALAPHVRRLVAVEVDRRLIPILEETVAHLSNVRIVHGHFWDVSLPSLGEGLLPVGNLPYGITSEVSVKLIPERAVVDRALFMV